MITDSFCELQYDEQHQCHYCKNCICKKGDVYYESREPTDAEIEAEIERQIARSEAIADRM